MFYPDAIRIYSQVRNPVSSLTQPHAPYVKALLGIAVLLDAQVRQIKQQLILSFRHHGWKENMKGKSLILRKRCYTVRLENL